MPYIDRNQRADLDELIDALSHRIKKPGAGEKYDLAGYAGILNYVSTRLALNLMGPVAYWKVAMIAGVFSNVVDEFYRRLATPYEDKKILENGDVYPHA